MAITERVQEALEAAAERNSRRTAEEQKQIDMMVLLATHLLFCCPIVATAPDKHEWIREHHPAIGAPGCVCNGVPMRVLDAQHFLDKRRKRRERQH
jgi:hypothetical protein